MTAIDSNADPINLLQKLKALAPDLWETSNRSLILPPTLGGFNRPEYVENMQNILNGLNQYAGMLNAGIISQTEYQSKKNEILSSMQKYRII